MMQAAFFSLFLNNWVINQVKIIFILLSHSDKIKHNYDNIIKDEFKSFCSCCSVFKKFCII